jgi:hypothetical protein
MLSKFQALTYNVWLGGAGLLNLLSFTSFGRMSKIGNVKIIEYESVKKVFCHKEFALIIQF